MMTFGILQQNTKRVVAGLLAFWLSGVVFLFCCETSQAKISEAESCPLAKASHCHKKSGDADVSQFASLQTENKTFDCCHFPSQIFDKARKLETIQQSATVSTNVKVLPAKVLSVKTDFKFPRVYQSFVRNRGGTFLRNRVFRI